VEKFRVSVPSFKEIKKSTCVPNQFAAPLLVLRGGIGEAMDGEAAVNRGISDGLESFDGFGEGPMSLDYSSSHYEPKPSHFNQSDNQMDGYSRSHTTSSNIGTFFLDTSAHPISEEEKPTI
jgi:hypothetical protein